MIKLIIFLILVIIIVSAFSFDLGFFTTGITNLFTSLTNGLSVFGDFFKNMFNLVFEAPTLSMFLGISIAMIIIELIINSLIGKGNDK